MMKRWLLIVPLLVFQSLECLSLETFPTDDGVDKDDPSLVVWADGYTNYLFGSELSEEWKTPAKALGKAAGDSYDIVGLGRGGEITLTFSHGIANQEGADFVVFENGVHASFLELAYVEVSSDGEHFVRFPNYSYSPGPIGTYGNVDPTLIYGLASRYMQGIGTPFDLNELVMTSNTIASGTHTFSLEYTAAFNANIGHLDFNHISHVKLIDIVGDGYTMDSEGFGIYDPYPTLGSAGFDLDAVGVINRSAVNGELQEIKFDPMPHQQLDFQSLELSAEADSGLPVSFAIASGPATVTNNVLYFTGTGTVEVVGSQGGNAVYAPASPVLHSFRVAEQIQHIFVEPVADVVALPGYLIVNAYSSSGLPVHMHVQSGEGNIDELGHIYVIPSTAGTVILRASQSGDATTAPAEDVLVSFQLVENLDGIVGFSSWLSSNDVPTVGSIESVDRYGRHVLSLSYALPTGVQASSRLLVSDDLITWTNAIPEITSQAITNGMLEMDVLVPMVGSNQFFRVEFEGR